MSLLKLPNELILSILHHITVIPEDKQRALKRVALTCTYLLPIAQEALLLEPFVNIHRIHDLINQYNKHPHLRPKVTTLELHANDQEGCTCSYTNGLLAHAALQSFSRLVTLLPNINTLLLGANQLKDITPLHFLFAGNGRIFCSHHGFVKPAAPNPLASLPSHCFPAIASRITTLELPVIWAQKQIKNRRDTDVASPIYAQYHEAFWYLRGFTSLKHLTTTFHALTADPYCEYLANPSMPFPATLETLTVSYLEGKALFEFVSFLEFLIEGCNKGPNLRRIDIWCHDVSALEYLSGYDDDAYCAWKVKGNIEKYVPCVQIHYDNEQSDWMREIALAEERSGRKVGAIEYFGREARGLFEGFRKEAEGRRREALWQERWLESEEKRVLRERRRVQEWMRREEERKREEKEQEEWIEQQEKMIEFERMAEEKRKGKRKEALESQELVEEQGEVEETKEQDQLVVTGQITMLIGNLCDFFVSAITIGGDTTYQVCNVDGKEEEVEEDVEPEEEYVDLDNLESEGEEGGGYDKDDDEEYEEADEDEVRGGHLIVHYHNDASDEDESSSSDESGVDSDEEETSTGEHSDADSDGENSSDEEDSSNTKDTDADPNEDSSSAGDSAVGL